LVVAQPARRNKRPRGWCAEHSDPEATVRQNLLVVSDGVGLGCNAERASNL
jgi:hypothetical protein